MSYLQPFADRDSSRRSFSSELAGTGLSGATTGPLSPSLGAEPRGLNARGSASGDRSERPGFFSRASSTGVGNGSAKSTTPGDSPNAPRERFGGIQGGVLSGVAPPERRRKESEGGVRTSRLTSSQNADELGSRSGDRQNGQAVFANGIIPSSKLDDPNDVPFTANAAGDSSVDIQPRAPTGPHPTSSWSARRRDRAPGEGPIGPPADGSGGFSKFAGYDRKVSRPSGEGKTCSSPSNTCTLSSRSQRERTAGHTGESWRSTSGPSVTAANGSAASTDHATSAEHDNGAKAIDSDAPGPQSKDQDVHDAASALRSFSVGEPGDGSGESLAPQESLWSAESQMWLYRDPSGQVQGPFAAVVMQDWYEQNYFTPDLMVRPDQEAEFHPLAEWFEMSGRDPKFFLTRPPSLRRPVLPTHPSSSFQPDQPALGFGSPSLGRIGGVDLSHSSAEQVGSGPSPWGEQPHRQPYLDGHPTSAAWTGQQHPHLQHQHAQLGFGSRGFGSSPFDHGYGSPFRGHTGLPGVGSELSLDARLRQQEEYVAMIRRREIEEQARQSAVNQGYSFGQFPNGPSSGASDVFGHERPWLPRDPSWGVDPSSNPAANQSPWAPSHAVSGHQVGDRSSRAPWDESIISSGDHVQPIGTPIRSRSPTAAPTASAAGMAPVDVPPPSTSAEQPEPAMQATTSEAAPAVPAPAALEDADESTASAVPEVTPAESPEPAEERPVTPQPEDPAPEQDWPQSPSAVEFAAEPDFNQPPALETRGDRKPRGASGSFATPSKPFVGTQAGKSAAAPPPSAVGGNVKVVGAEQFRKGGRSSTADPQSPSTSVQTPLSSFLPQGPATVSTPTSAKVAPWAQQNEVAPPQPAAMSLREIQEAEARQAESRRAAERAAAAQRRAAAAAANGSGSEKLPTTMSWGLASIPSTAKNASGPGSTGSGGRESPVTTAAPAAWTANKAAPKKTLTEIQEEERKRVAAQQKLKAAQAAATRKAYADSAVRPAAPAAAPAPGWSVVGAGGKTASQPSNGTPSTPSVRPTARTTGSSAQIPGVAGAWGISGAAGNSSSSNATAGGGGAAVRKAPSTTSNTSVSTSSGSGSGSPSPEFLRYCKEQLRGLNVKVDDFIEMLLSFPLDPSPDVIEIIAESIYANSSTLDGRRLANDFVTKRKMDAGVSATKGGSSGVSGAGGAGAAAASQHGFQQVVKKGGKKRA